MRSAQPACLRTSGCGSLTVTLASTARLTLVAGCCATETTASCRTRQTGSCSAIGREHRIEIGAEKRRLATLAAERVNSHAPHSRNPIVRRCDHRGGTRVIGEVVEQPETLVSDSRVRMAQRREDRLRERRLAAITKRFELALAELAAGPLQNQPPSLEGVLRPRPVFEPVRLGEPLLCGLQSLGRLALQQPRLPAEMPQMRTIRKLCHVPTLSPVAR